MTDPADPTGSSPTAPALSGSALSEVDRGRLRRCVDLAEEALEAGDEPFGSLLVGADGTELFADRNRVAGGDATRHPEFAIARWAAEHLSPDERTRATVYTSGEHCPMCSAAHAWVGLGRIVFIASSAQLTEWRSGWGAPASPVAPLPVQSVAPGIPVEGPVPELQDAVRRLHRRHVEASNR